MFCIKCGKPAFAGNFCEECYVEKKELFELKDVKMRYCDNCLKFYTYKEKISPEALENFLLEQMISKNTIQDTKIKTSQRPDMIHAVITAKGLVRPSKKLIEDQKEITIHPRKMKCDNCVKILGNYHEAVVQVRGEKKERIMAKTRKLLKPTEYANIATLKEGYDIRVIDKSVAGRLAQALRENFAVKQSFKLVGEKKGKKIYRNFYSVR